MDRVYEVSSYYPFLKSVYILVSVYGEYRNEENGSPKDGYRRP